jgi:hypothetical protein
MTVRPAQGFCWKWRASWPEERTHSPTGSPSLTEKKHCSAGPTRTACTVVGTSLRSSQLKAQMNQVLPLILVDMIADAHLDIHREVRRAVPSWRVVLATLAALEFKLPPLPRVLRHALAVLRWSESLMWPVADRDPLSRCEGRKSNATPTSNAVHAGSHCRQPDHRRLFLLCRENGGQRP